ncbi:hypothetical protein RhiirA5_433028 [Rhizophagus irregularis]|uniref:Uncharacterized protein n=1 Tax=Rhizophagus irregularis TaxID=588596 RepID=A0A2N0NSH0_9GLOM|nr:hypothetical protein RhiirA5_433028 [Rhizophagus irregularis]
MPRLPIDYIACTIALLNSTPLRLLQTQLLKLPNLSLLDGRIPLFDYMMPKAFKAYYPILLGQCSPDHTPFWYKDIQRQTTISFDSNNRLVDGYIIPLPVNNPTYFDLESCLSSPPTTMNWIVTLDEFGSPIFGKQLLVQPVRGICSIVHWISPDCESSPEDGVHLHYNRWDIAPNFSPIDAIEASVIPTTVEFSAAAVFANSPLIPSTDSRYLFIYFM